MSQQHKKWLDLVEQRLDEKNWSRSDLAIVIGVSPAMITKLLKTGQGSDELKLQVNRKLNISESWVDFKERQRGMEKENTRLEFYIALIELYEDIVQKQAKLNRQLIDFLKKEKEPIEMKIDSEKISDIY